MFLVSLFSIEAMLAVSVTREEAPRIIQARMD